MISIVIAQILELLILVVFWQIVAVTADIGFESREIISYFLIAIGIRAMAYTNLNFGSTIGKMIQFGEMNYYLIKPIRIIPVLFLGELGVGAVSYFVSILGLVAGVLIAGPAYSLTMLWIIPALVATFFISFALNMFIGTFAFYFTDSSGFKNVARHILRFLSGLLIPLTLLPELLREALLLTPFPNLIFIPTEILRNGQAGPELVGSVISGLFWAVLLMLLANRYWLRGLRRYEAVGV